MKVFLLLSFLNGHVRAGLKFSEWTRENSENSSKALFWLHFTRLFLAILHLLDPVYTMILGKNQIICLV